MVDGQQGELSSSASRELVPRNTAELHVYHSEDYLQPFDDHCCHMGTAV